MLPADTITYTYYIDGIDEFDVETQYPLTILGASFTQGGTASETQLLCGQEMIFNNFAKDISYVEMNKVCNDVLSVEKTGQDEAMLLINYVLYDVVEASTTQQINIKNGMTYGDILTNYFLFIIMLGFIFGFLVKNFIIKKK